MSILQVEKNLTNLLCHDVTSFNWATPKSTTLPLIYVPVSILHKLIPSRSGCPSNWASICTPLDCTDLKAGFLLPGVPGGRFRRGVAGLAILTGPVKNKNLRVISCSVNCVSQY